MPSQKFTFLAGQYVRLDSVTRLSTEPVMGNPGATAHYVYISDGGILYLTEEEFEGVKKALTSEAPAKRKATAKKGA